MLKNMKMFHQNNSLNIVSLFISVNQTLSEIFCCDVVKTPHEMVLQVETFVNLDFFEGEDIYYP